MDRRSLPFRENCEVYVFQGKNVLAHVADGYVQFPGGGIDTGESAKQAVVRETQEETGVLLGSLCHLETLEYDWGPGYVTTPKQQYRYARFRGERMHVFAAEVVSEGEPTDPEDAWEEKWLGVSEAVALMEKLPVDEPMVPYRQAQLRHLITIGNELGDERYVADEKDDSKKSDKY